MAQENLVNFYKTQNINTISTTPDDGSFIYNDYNDGLYIVNGTEIRKLNTALPMVVVNNISKAPWGTCKGVKIQEGTAILLYSPAESATINSIKLNDTTYNAHLSKGVKLESNVAQLIVFTENMEESGYPLEFYSISSSSDEVKGQLNLNTKTFTVLKSESTNNPWVLEASSVYSQTIDVEGVEETDYIIVDIDMNQDAATVVNSLKAYKNIHAVAAKNGQIKVYAFSNDGISSFFPNNCYLQALIIKENS